MFAKFYTLIPYHLQLIKFKVDENNVFPVPTWDIIVLEAKKRIFAIRHGLCNFLFLSLGKFGTCLQNLIPTTCVEH
jgi:hypothetical protein